MKSTNPGTVLAFFFLLLTGVGHTQSVSQRLLKHVVMVTFKENAPASGVQAVDASFGHLADTLSMVKGYEWGPALPQGQTKTVTHVYVFSFDSESALAAYAQSPAHQRHIKVGADIIERVQAVQYWTEK